MIEIPISRGFIAKIDDDDIALVDCHSWYADVRKHTVYAGTSKTIYDDKGEGRQTSIRMHNAILGVSARQRQIDHIDGDGLNNQRHNLRFCTPSQNNANIPYRGNKFRGVSFMKQWKKWHAGIQINNRSYNLGNFDRPEDAAMAYDRFAFEAWGEFARLNFPKDAA